MRSSLLATILVLSFILAAAIGMFFLLRGGGWKEPLDCLPQETRFLVRITDPPALARALASTPLVSAEAGEINGVLAPASDLLESFLRSQGIDSEIPAVEIARAFASEIVVASVPDGQPDRWGLALIVSAPAGAQKSLAALARLTSQWIPGFSESWWSTHRHHGIEYLTLRPPGGTGAISAAALKGILVVTTSTASMRNILEVAEGRGGSLGRTAAFRQIREHLGRSADLLAFGAADWIRSLIASPSSPPDNLVIAKLLGLPALRGAGLAIQVRKGLFQEQLFVSLAGEGRGLSAQLLGSEPRARRPGRFARLHFPFFGTISTAGLDSAFNRLPELIAGATGDPTLQLRARLAGLEEFLSIDLKRELLAAFGDEIALSFGGASTWPRRPTGRQALNTPAVAAVSLRDPGAAARVLRRLDGLARALGAYRTLTAGGETIAFYEIPSIAPLRPSYRLTRTHLIASTSPELLSDPEGDGTDALAASRREQIDRLLKLLPREAHFFLGAESPRLVDLLDAPRAARSLPAGVAGSLLRALVEASRRTDLPLTIAAARLGEEGLQAEWIGPVSPALLACLALAGHLQDWGAAETAPDTRSFPVEDKATGSEIPD